MNTIEQRTAQQVRPLVSIIVVAYNMARELPRTIRSLSTSLQRGVVASDYEIVVVDNGSTNPFDRNEVLAQASNVLLASAPNPTRSPVGAIHHGMSLVSGDVIGVMIDGARMASPGLVANAIAASKVCDWPVIATHAFHLGDDNQSRSTLRGYNQDVEDILLARTRWEEDGYRLFNIAAWGGSSKNGWFAIPAETSALFLKRDHWARLGGYDLGFQAAGGGLANIDMWSRACADPEGKILLLLGEATFHQVHGGVSTNSGINHWTEFHDEYVRLRGHDYVSPSGRPFFFGSLHPAVAKSLRFSSEMFVATADGVS